MKILHISGARTFGGNERQLLDMIPELHKRGIENIVLGLSGKPLEERCLAQSISFINIDSPRLNKIGNYLKIKNIIKDVNPDVIHLHTSESLTIYVIIDLLFGLKIKTFFSKKGLNGSSSIFSKLKYCYKNLNKIICVSEAVKRSMLDYAPENKMVVIYDGINANRFLQQKKNINIHKEYNIPQDRIIVGNIANHFSAKDLPTLIKTANYIVNELNVKNIHFLQIGLHTQKISTEVKRLITEEYNIEDYVTLTGFVEDVASLFDEFSVYFMSSVREGLPLTIYEAFYKKVPVVSTKAGGIPELIIDSYNGYLSETGDYKRLGESIVKLVNDENRRKVFAERSYDIFMEGYTTEILIEKMIQLYQD